MAEFDMDHVIMILQKTPGALKSLLWDIPDDFSQHNEGSGTWSPFDILGHLIHGENTDWIPRLTIMLLGNDQKFEVFDRTAMFDLSRGKSVNALLNEFEALRKENVKTLINFDLNGKSLEKTGIHPEFGTITVRQLLSTWAVHDLSHISQITRVMAKQYKHEIGPWLAYFNTLK